MNKSGNRVVVLSCALLCLALLPSKALAGDGGIGPGVSGSAEGTADGGGVVTISVESSVTTAGSGGVDGGGVTSSLSFSRVVNLPVVKV